MAGADFEAAMKELGALVTRPDFQQKQAAFFDKYCEEFDGTAEENKLSYTTIHNEYVAQIEKDIEGVLGADKLTILCEGAEEYAISKSDVASAEGAEALNVLTSLADFESFKAAMLAKKAAKHADGVALSDVKGVLDINEAINYTAQLRQAATEADGWVCIVDEPNAVFYTKDAPEGNTYLRYTVEIELPPQLAFECFADFSPESQAWRDKMTNIEIVKDFGPNDQVVQYQVAVPWAVSYVMSLPSTMCVRMIKRENWPEQGDFAYVCAPFDLEKNMALEEMGSLKTKSGVISAHKTNPSMSMLTGCDLVNVSYMPTFGLAFVLKKLALSNIASQTAAFKTTKGL